MSHMLKYSYRVKHKYPPPHICTYTDTHIFFYRLLYFYCQENVIYLLINQEEKMKRKTEGIFRESWNYQMM